MSDPIIIKDQKFTKVKGVWLDQKKNPAPKELIPLLDKMEATYMSAPPPLPSIPNQISSSSGSNSKTDVVLNKLVVSIEKLTKSIEKLNSSEAKKEQVAQKVSSADKIPSLLGAMGLNTKEFFAGKKDEYGRVTQPGLVRQLTSTLVAPSRLLFAAQDRRREAIAQRKMNSTESVLPTTPAVQQAAEIDMSQAQASTSNIQSVKIVDIDDASINKLLSLLQNKPSSPSTPPEQLPAVPDTGVEFNKKSDRWLDKKTKQYVSKNVAEKILGKSVGEVEENLTMTNSGQSKYAAKEFADEKVQSVKLTDIDDSAVKKFLEIFGKKEDETIKKEAGGESKGSIFGGLLGALSAAGSALMGFVGNLGKITSFIGGMAGKGINAVKGIFGIESKSAEKAGIKVVEKEGIKAAEKAGAKALGKSLLKKIPGVGLAVGGAFAIDRAIHGDFLGAGGELASGAASLIPGVGTAASIGIDAALAARDMTKTSAELTPAIMTSPTGLVPQTQALNVTTKRVMQEKEKKMMQHTTPVITNISSPTTNVMNSNQTIAGMTMGPRGSLDIETYRTRAL